MGDGSESRMVPRQRVSCSEARKLYIGWMTILPMTQLKQSMGQQPRSCVEHSLGLLVGQERSKEGSIAPRAWCRPQRSSRNISCAGEEPSEAAPEWSQVLGTPLDLWLKGEWRFASDLVPG